MMRRKLSKLLLAVTVTFSIFACSQMQSEYVDVGDQEPYVNVVGESYETLRDLQIIGVTSDPDYKGGIDFYLVLPNPGTSGPEVLLRKRLPTGTVFLVQGFQRCSNCTAKDERALIEFRTANNYADKPIYMANLGGEKLFTSNAEGIEINREYFTAK